jgi:hypothetical protein
MAAGITVALGVLTVLVILGPRLIDPLLASDRIETVRAVVIALLANEIGRCGGQTTLPDGTFLFRIEADGAWTITSD